MDVSYRGNVKVFMLNKSQENFNIELEDRIAQFILTRYKTPDVDEVDRFNATSRDMNYFGSARV